MRYGSAAVLQDSFELDPSDFNYFRQAIHQEAGIALSETKQDLVKTRLRGHVQSLGYSSFGEYRSYLESLPKKDPEWQLFINVLTTNKTDFFREPSHFTYVIKNFIPEWEKSGDSTLKVWSAASSTGEEPYTISMVLHHALPKNKSYKILGTDIDTNVLRTASNGVYNKMKLPEIPQNYQQYVSMGREDLKNWFRIKPEIKDKIVYKTHNLIEKSTPNANEFSLIFCRNVFIYFNKETIQFVLNKLYYSAKPGAALFIGHSESLQNIDTEWVYESPSIYRKIDK